MNLKELAALLGLSQTTVSRALNGYPEVSDATRRRVADAARAHGYRPNPRARSLATGQSRVIGHVIPISTRHEIVNPVFSDFIAGASERYSRRGYTLSLTVVPDNDQDRAYRDLADRASVDGVVLHAPQRNDPRIDLLRSIGLPFVVHGRASEVTSSYNWVDVNNFAAFKMATDYLIGLGHRRIALINGLESMDFAYRRRAGWEAGLQQAGIIPDPELTYASEMTETHGCHAARALLSLAEPPTAMLTSSIISAFGARRAIEARGLELGKDISIATHDDDLSYLRNDDTPPVFTTVMSSVRLAGRICADTLIDQIETPDSPPRTHLLEAELIAGASTGPAPLRMILP